MIATNLVALALMAALNPLVARAPEPRGNIPADCVVSDAPPMPRITVAVADSSQEDASVPLPPVRPAARATATSTASTTSSSDIADLRRALAANDRPAFDAALARAKAAGLSTRVYEDVARIWDAQFQSPFFAEDSDAYRVASSYPGYAEAVRRQVFTDASGRKFYPAAESRAFVATHAGIRAPETRSVMRSARIGTTTGAAPTPSRSTPKRSTKTASRKPAASGKKAPPTSPDPPAAPKVAAREPAPVVSPVADTSSTEAPPVAGSLDTTEPAPAIVDTMATETVVTDTATTDITATTVDTATDTATTAITDTATTTSEPAPATKGRPILIPAILILIGLGVLILLFRTKA